MSDILTDYREWRDKQPDRIGTHSDRCHMWERHERCMIHRLAAALAAEMAKRTPQPHATPGEGTSHGVCTLTTYERDVLQRMLEYQQRLAGDATEPRGWMAIQADTDADIIRGLIARLT